MIKKMKNTKDPKAEGMKIAAGLIRELRTMCDGVHIMPIGNHENTKTLLEMAGLL